EVDPAVAEGELDRHEWDALMTVLHNRGAWGRSNARVVGDRVAAYSKAPPPDGAEHVDYGVLLARSGVFDAAPPAPLGLADMLTPVAAAGRLGAHLVRRRFLEIGTPAALAEVRDVVGGGKGEPPA